MRHNAVIDLIKSAIVSANVPSLLEPNSLWRLRKRPNGLTVLPWANGRCLVWDFTCSDTLAWTDQCWDLGELWRTTRNHGSQPNTRSSLPALYRFIPIDTLGVPGRPCWRRSAVILSWPQSAHCSCHSWTTFIPVPDAASRSVLLQYNVAMQLASSKLQVPSFAGWPIINHLLRHGYQLLTLF